MDTCMYPLMCRPHNSTTTKYSTSISWPFKGYSKHGCFFKVFYMARSANRFALGHVRLCSVRDRSCERPTTQQQKTPETVVTFSVFNIPLLGVYTDSQRSGLRLFQPPIPCMFLVFQSFMFYFFNKIGQWGRPISNKARSVCLCEYLV